MFDFPNTPAVGDTTVNSAGLVYRWDGVKWVAVGARSSVAGVTSFNTRQGAVALSSVDISGAGGALLSSPAFTGNPTAPTPSPGDNDTSVATTAFVMAALPSSGVSTFNTRSGAVVLTLNDVTSAGAAPLANANLTGNVTAPTPAVDDSTTKIATTAFVIGQASGALPLMDGVAAIGAQSRWARSDHVHPRDTGVLPLVGGTMLGPITLSADPAAAMQPVTLQYYNAHLPTGGGPPSGTAGGDLTGTYPNPTLATSGVVSGSYTNTNLTVDAKGRITVAANGPASPAASSTIPLMDSTAAVGTGTTYARADHVHPTDTSRLASNATAGGDLTGTYPSPALATTTVAAGSYTAANITVDAKGRLTAAANGAVPGPSSTNPIMDGIVAIGTGTTYARADHVHPSDTSRAPLASPAFTGTPAMPTGSTGVTQAAGNNSTALATTAFVQAATAPALNNVGRNLLHNPLFNVAQRGLSGFTASAGVAVYTGDRWYITKGIAADAYTAAINAAGDTDRTAVGDEALAFYLTNQFTGNSAAAAACLMSQPIEGVRRLAGKTVTVSFWAVASASLKIGVSINQVFGSGGSPSATVNGAGQSITATSTWARYSLTFNIASASGKTLGTNLNSDFTTLSIWFSSGTNNASNSGNVGVQSGTVNISGLQLEIGSVATPLEKIDLPQEIARCQRFYQVGQLITAGYAQVASQVIYYSSLLPVPMRAPPTVTPANANNTNCSIATAGVYNLALGPCAIWFQSAATAAGGYTSSTSFTASADF